MSSIVVQAFITLDGVVQGEGDSNEDREGGFPHGGWATDYDSAHGGNEVFALVAEWERHVEALLLGRKTYTLFADSWGTFDEDADGLEGELTRRYNRIPKYVTSHTLTDARWKNTPLINCDVVAEVAKLRAEPGEGEIRVWGSTRLIRSLAENDLVDEYRLICYPIVLGTGKKLFSEGFPTSQFTLTDFRTVGGVLVTRYLRSDNH